MVAVGFFGSNGFYFYDVGLFCPFETAVHAICFRPATFPLVAGKKTDDLGQVESECQERSQNSEKAHAHNGRETALPIKKIQRQCAGRGFDAARQKRRTWSFTFGF